MKPRFLALCCALAAGIQFAGCKKAEPPVSSAPEPAVPTSTAPAPAAAETKPSSAAGEKPAADALELKVKWPVGARYVFRMDLEQHSTNRIPQFPKPMEQNTSMAMTYAAHALSETPDKGHEIELEFLANEMEVKMGEQTIISFDSKEKAQDENPMTAPFRKMIGSKIRLQVDAKGKVEKVVNMEEWRTSLLGANPGPAGGMLAQQFSEAYFQQILGFGAALPAKPVQVGDTWPYHVDIPAGPMGKISADTTVTFKGLEERQQRTCAALSVTGTFKGSADIPSGPMGKMMIEDGRALGVSWFDPELGMPVESSVDQTMKLKGAMPSPPGGNRGPGGEFTVEIGQKTGITLVEVGKAQP